MPKLILKGFTQSPDTGLLKNGINEYENLQNIRGWGDLGSKRRGVQTRVTLDTGIMGMFDLKIDSDPTSPDKIAVFTNGGDLVLYNYSELISSFDFMFETGITLALQSPDLNWWKLDVSSTFPLGTTGIVAPSTTISQDLNISQNELFGFQDATGVTRVFIDDKIIETKRYNLSTPVVSYSTVQAYTNGFGPVFQDSLLQNWRLVVDNTGALDSEQV